MGLLSRISKAVAKSHTQGPAAFLIKNIGDLAKKGGAPTWAQHSIGAAFGDPAYDYQKSRDRGESANTASHVTLGNVGREIGGYLGVMELASLLEGGGESSAGSSTGGSGASSLWDYAKTGYSYGSKGYSAYNTLAGLFKGGGGGASAGASPAASGGYNPPLTMSMNEHGQHGDEQGFFAQKLMDLYQPTAEPAANDFSPLLSEFGVSTDDLGAMYG